MSNENPAGQTAAPWGDPASVGEGRPVTGSTGKRASVLGAWGARIVLIVVAACALVSVAFILFGAGGDTLGRVVTTDVALVVFALLVWLDTVIGAYRPEWFEFASLATDAYLLLLWIVTIWTENGSGPFVLWADIWRGILCLIFVRGMLALADLVRLLYSRWVTTVTRVLAFVSAGAFGVIAVMVTIPAPNPFSHLWDYDFYGRIVASLAVIAGVALVLIPLWGLLINRSHRTQRTAGYGAGGAYPGASFGGNQYGSGNSGTGYPGSGYPAAGYPAGAAQPGYAPPVPSVPPAPGAQQGLPPVASAPGAQQGASPAASHPPLTWPRLANGAPVPADQTGAPDFRAVGGAPLAWPTFLDGTPVPTGPDGSPLYR
ncbi:hypothetical protein ACO2Q7_08140 [Rathayibacter sp. KR2-224]|uniref:hypothetical protein n=1 Tax=Rathayibacter sp. KR2-224 TaxID=3400913 RepID=UPI003C03FA41